MRCLGVDIVVHIICRAAHPLNAYLQALWRQNLSEPKLIECVLTRDGRRAWLMCDSSASTVTEGTL